MTLLGIFVKNEKCLRKK